MSHGCKWGHRDFPWETFHTDCIHLVKQTEMFSRSLSKATFEVQKFTHETFKNYWVWSQMRSSMTVSPAFCCSLPDLHTCNCPRMRAIPNACINPFLPVRHRMVLFQTDTPPCPCVLTIPGHRVNTVKPKPPGNEASNANTLTLPDIFQSVSEVEGRGKNLSGSFRKWA